jgi:hypothetical protein
MGGASRAAPVFWRFNHDGWSCL